MLFPGILADGSLIATAASIRTSLGLGTADNPTFGNLTVTNITVNGTVTTINSATITVDDPLIRLGDNNSADTVDLGIYGLYVSSGSKYTGIFRDATDGKYKLFTALQEEPTTTVNAAGTGYTVGTLVASIEGSVNGVTLTAAGSASDFLNAAGNYVSAGVSDHGALTGLSDDDHSIYALLAGRSGGQTLIGGTASGNNLTLQSTSHSTKGNIVASAVTIGPPTLSGTSTVSNFLNVTGTLPSTTSDNTYGVNFQITSSGSSAFQQRAISVDLLSGYSGPAKTQALAFSNQAAGTASDLQLGISATHPDGNLGISGQSTTATTGLNLAGSFEARLGNLNLAVFGKTISAKNSATNIAVAGFALNTGSSPVQIGGYFGLQNATPTFASAAVLADNGSTTSPIALFRDNGSIVWAFADGGDVTRYGLSSTSTVREQTDWITAAIDNTDATRKYRSVHRAYDTAAREYLRGWGDGSAGRIACAAPASAPTDAHLAASQISFYLDETGHNLLVRAKYADGTTLKLATIALA